MNFTVMLDWKSIAALGLTAVGFALVFKDPDAAKEALVHVSDAVFFVKHFSLKKASKFPVFIEGISLLLAGVDYVSLRIKACSIR